MSNNEVSATDVAPESDSAGTERQSLVKGISFKLKIAPRLVAILLFFGLTPAAVLFSILWVQGAVIKDAFEDTDLKARFNGKPAIMVAVSRTDEQDTIAISETVVKYIQEHQAGMPQRVRAESPECDAEHARGCTKQFA